MQPITPDLIRHVRERQLGGRLLDDGALRYVVFLTPVRMVPIIRTAQESITATVARQAANFDVVVNGNYFDASFWMYTKAAAGLAQPAANTTIQGEVVRHGRVVAGDSQPRRFYLAEVRNLMQRVPKQPDPHKKKPPPPPPFRFQVGQGDPPLGAGTVAAVGNLGPMLVHGLPYGVGNRYRPRARTIRCGSRSASPRCRRRRRRLRQNRRRTTGDAGGASGGPVVSRRGLAGRLALAGGCALVSALLVALTSDQLMLAGTTAPAAIWAPRGGLAGAVVPVAAAVLAVALAEPRRWPGALLLWLAVLALVTHRVVDISEGSLIDVWLGVPIRISVDWREEDADPRQCGLALCVTRAGRLHRLPTLLPFEMMREDGTRHAWSWR